MQIPILQRRGQVKPYGSIPRINWSHPLAFGLAVYAYDVGGFVVDLVGGNSGALATATTIGRKSTAFGSAYNYTTSTGAIQLPSAPGAFGATQGTTISIAPWTVAAGFFVTADTTASCLFALSDSAGNNKLGVVTGGSATTMNYITSNGTNDMDGVTVPSKTNKYSTAALTAPTSTSAIAYFNGLQVDSQAVSNACATAAPSVPTINTLQQGALSFNGVTGAVYYGAIWDRVLTQPELLELHQDPYCFLIYPEDEIFATLVGVASGGGPSCPMTRAFLGVGC